MEAKLLYDFEKYLQLKQNTCAARIFLNAFNLILEENVENIDQFLKLKIFDSDMNEVGKLYFKNGKVFISANFNNNVLNAEFNIAKIYGYYAILEDNIQGNWNNDIDFQLQQSNGIKLSGQFEIRAALDSEYGIHCNCHPLIKYEVDGKEMMILKMFRDGSELNLQIMKDNYKEKIDVCSWDKNRYLYHEIIKGEYDRQKLGNPFSRYVLVKEAEDEKNKGKLASLLSETNYIRPVLFETNYIPKNSNNSIQLSLQIGKLMRELDPSMYERIKETKEILKIDNKSIFDDLVGICFEKYTNEQVEALLGVTKNKILYQDGNDTLANSYFGINKSDYFFPKEMQKKLVKK